MAKKRNKYSVNNQTYNVCLKIVKTYLHKAGFKTTQLGNHSNLIRTFFYVKYEEKLPDNFNHKKVLLSKMKEEHYAEYQSIREGVVKSKREYFLNNNNMNSRHDHPVVHKTKRGCWEE